MRETFCIGVLETDGFYIARGMLLFIPLQLIMLPFLMLIDISRVMFMLLFFGVVKYADLGDGNIEFLLFFSVLLLLYQKDVLRTFRDVEYALLILVTGGKSLRWVARGYMEGKSFRIGIVENEDNANIITATTGLIKSEYRVKYDHLLKLYMNIHAPDGEEELKAYMEQLRKENNERRVVLQ